MHVWIVESIARDICILAKTEWSNTSRGHGWSEDDLTIGHLKVWTTDTGHGRGLAWQRTIHTNTSHLSDEGVHGGVGMVLSMTRSWSRVMHGAMVSRHVRRRMKSLAMMRASRWGVATLEAVRVFRSHDVVRGIHGHLLIRIMLTMLEVRNLDGCGERIPGCQIVWTFGEDDYGGELMEVDCVQCSCERQ